MTHEHGPNCNHDHDDNTPSLAQQVQDIMGRVLYTDAEVDGLDRSKGEVPPGAVLIEGIVNNFGLHPERLMNEAENIRQILLKVVNDEYKTPDGASFLGLCVDREGNQWAEHPTMEALCGLAMGLRWATCVMPREFWIVLPGGVPYYAFDFDEKPPILKYLKAVKKEPTQLDEAGERRRKIWACIAELGKNPASVLLQVMWEQMEVRPIDARKMTAEERVWVLTNAGIEPDTNNVREALKRFEVDPDTVFKEA